MLKGKCHAIHFGFPFNTVQFICKEIRYQKIWVTRKQLKINQSYASFSIATHWNRNLGNCGEMKQYVDH